MSSAPQTPDFPTAYEPHDVEAHWTDVWRRLDVFAGPDVPVGDVFSVVIPPPNVTGQLHMGHALNGTIQDILVRRARMQGRPTVWIPGTDHAGIATQNVVERRLAAEGLSRHDLGREDFVKRVWEWKEEYEARILGQMSKLGLSVDWNRTRFTMDPGLSESVREVFVRWFDAGLIYRGLRIINWCPRCETALSDIEVKHADRDGELVTLAYPLTDGTGEILVATTRVETMLGDTGVAVHPSDDRYTSMIGKTVTLPITGREIPIVADEAVESEFGTGAVKVTPAHDPTDFEIGERHHLGHVNIFNPDATLNDEAGEFSGLDRFEARKRVREALAKAGVVRAEERPYVHSVGHCDRCDTVVEPWLSDQWFVDAKTLAGPAIEAVTSGKVKIHPKRFEKTYLDWMINIRDWCISRQLWWGHRIPVWTCANEHTFAARVDPSACPECGSSELVQDPDVLDTWFSSQLWPFSTFGWPTETAELRSWYPTSVLVTAYEILYLWVARMMMAGQNLMGDVPFHDVLIHGIVRDFEGAKMSKSKGNTVDPLEWIDQYGTDALRFTLARQAIPGQDTNVAEDWIEGDRRFANKIWNAARFVLTNLDGATPAEPAPESLNLADRWILSRLDAVVETVDRNIQTYEIGEAAKALYHFVWSEYCDWYLEAAKLTLDSESTRWVLREVLETSLRLLHPVMPFITEELYARTPGTTVGSLSLAGWPEPAGRRDAAAEAAFAAVRNVVSATRSWRHERAVSPKDRLDVVVTGDDGTLKGAVGLVSSMARLGEVRFEQSAPADTRTKVVADQVVLWIAVDDDTLQAERTRLERLIEKNNAVIAQASKKLGNPGFVDGAPDSIVDKVRSEMETATAQIAELTSQLDAISG